MMQPAIQIAITADEETVRMICATIGFLAMCWVACRALIEMHKEQKPTEEPS